MLIKHCEDQGNWRRRRIFVIILSESYMATNGNELRIRSIVRLVQSSVDTTSYSSLIYVKMWNTRSGHGFKESRQYCSEKYSMNQQMLCEVT